MAAFEEVQPRPCYSSSFSKNLRELDICKASQSFRTASNDADLIRCCGRFLGDCTKGLSHFQPRGTTARGGLVFHHADDHGPGREAPGLSDQAVPGTLAGEGSQVCRSYGEIHHPAGDKDQGDRTGAGRHAAEAGRRTAWRERRRGQSLGQVVSRRRYGRVAAQNVFCQIEVDAFST